MAMDAEHTWFAGLYTEFHPRVLAYAMRRVAGDVAREVADETFLIAWRRRSDLPDRPLPWLLVTARNVIADQVRRGTRQDAIALELARCSESVHAVGADAAAVERVTVLRALERLPSRDLEALMLTVWDGLAYREAAVMARCSTAAFAVRLHRARRRLAAAMGDLDKRSLGERVTSPTDQIDAEETQR